MSALREAFDREDLEVVAVYFQVCDGVDDPTAAIRRQVERHDLDYPVLNGTKGTIEDPTHALFRWVPRAVVVDARGRIVRPYGHIPAMEQLQEELKALVATGRVEPRPDDGWRNFRRGSWVRIRTMEDEFTREERHQLKAIQRGCVVLHIEGRDKTLPGTRPVFKDSDLVRKEVKAETVTIDGRDYRCRVIETTWKRTKHKGTTVSLKERSWIAEDPTLPETLLRRETTERSPKGAEITRTRRVLSLSEKRTIGEREVDCWSVESVSEWKTGRTEVRTWYSREVPGHEVRRVEKIRNHGHETESSTEVINFEVK